MKTCTKFILFICLTYQSLLFGSEELFCLTGDCYFRNSLEQSRSPQSLAEEIAKYTPPIIRDGVKMGRHAAKLADRSFRELIEKVKFITDVINQHDVGFTMSSSVFAVLSLGVNIEVVKIKNRVAYYCAPTLGLQSDIGVLYGIGASIVGGYVQPLNCSSTDDYSSRFFNVAGEIDPINFSGIPLSLAIVGTFVMGFDTEKFREAMSSLERAGEIDTRQLAGELNLFAESGLKIAGLAELSPEADPVEQRLVALRGIKKLAKNDVEFWNQFYDYLEERREQFPNLLQVIDEVRKVGSGCNAVSISAGVSESVLPVNVSAYMSYYEKVMEFTEDDIDELRRLAAIARRPARIREDLGASLTLLKLIGKLTTFQWKLTTGCLRGGWKLGDSILKSF